MNCGPTHFREVVTRRLPAIRSFDPQVRVKYLLAVGLPTAGSPVYIPQQFRTPLFFFFFFFFFELLD